MVEKDKSAKMSTKKVFKHFTAIPYFLRDSKIDLDEANEWQTNYLSAREIGLAAAEEYAWCLFHAKYYWSKGQNKWVLRQYVRQLPYDLRDEMIKRTFQYAKTGRNKNYVSFTEILDDIIKDLLKLRNGVCEIERELPPEIERPKKKDLSDFKSEIGLNETDSAVTNSAVENPNLD